MSSWSMPSEDLDDAVQGQDWFLCGGTNKAVCGRCSIQVLFLLFPKTLHVKDQFKKEPHIFIWHISVFAKRLMRSRAKSWCEPGSLHGNTSSFTTVRNSTDFIRASAEMKIRSLHYASAALTPRLLATYADSFKYFSHQTRKICSSCPPQLI